MRLEVRADSVAAAEEALVLPIDAVTLGHEACPFRLPALESTLRLFDRALALDVEPRLSLPLAFERHSSDIQRYLESVALRHPSVRVVVNDWGTLRYIARSDVASGCRVSIGRAMSYSYEACPWHEHVLELEDEGIRSMLLQHTLDGAEMLDLLSEYGVDEIEVDYLPGSMPSYSEFRSAGFMVNATVGLTVVSITRACHLTRHLGRQDEIGKGCFVLCDEPVRIDATQRWSLADGASYSIGSEASRLMPQLSVFANLICLEEDLLWDGGMPSGLDLIDSVTLDTRRYPGTQLAPAVQRMRQLS